MAYKIIEVAEVHAAKQKKLMDECLKERKEYECSALLNNNGGDDLLIINTGF